VEVCWRHGAPTGGEALVASLQRIQIGTQVNSGTGAAAQPRTTPDAIRAEILRGLQGHAEAHESVVREPLALQHGPC
jgi:hypothetical protein